MFVFKSIFPFLFLFQSSLHGGISFSQQTVKAGNFIKISLQSPVFVIIQDDNLNQKNEISVEVREKKWTKIASYFHHI